MCVIMSYFKYLRNFYGICILQFCYFIFIIVLFIFIFVIYVYVLFSIFIFNFVSTCIYLKPHQHAPSLYMFIPVHSKVAW